MRIEEIKQLLVDIKMRSEDQPTTTTKEIITLIEERLGSKISPEDKIK